MEDRYDTDIDDLWSAITDPSRLARWHGEVEGDLRVGGEVRCACSASGWEGAGVVEVCERAAAAAAWWARSRMSRTSRSSRPR